MDNAQAMPDKSTIVTRLTPVNPNLVGLFEIFANNVELRQFNALGICLQTELATETYKSRTGAHGLWMFWACHMGDFFQALFGDDNDFAWECIETYNKAI